MMEIRDGRDLGRNKVVRVLHYCWSYFNRSLHASAIIAYAVVRTLVAALAIGLFWIGLLVMKALAWIFE